MQRLQVHHTTTYAYRRPMTFGPHFWLFRPRDSHDLRILDVDMQVEPASDLRWYHDVYGNSITIVTFKNAAQNLRFESHIKIDHYATESFDYPIEETAETLPFVYPIFEQPDLARMIERHYPDANGEIEGWARRFLSQRGKSRTMDVLAAMNEAI